MRTSPTALAPFAKKLVNPALAGGIPTAGASGMSFPSAAGGAGRGREEGEKVFQ